MEKYSNYEKNLGSFCSQGFRFCLVLFFFGKNYGGVTRIWTGESEFCRLVPYRLAMTPNIIFYFDNTLYSLKSSLLQNKKAPDIRCFVWSGWRGSNPLPPPWQGGALPDELHPHFWRPGSGSNRRPLAWQASVLTNWTTGPKKVVGTTGLEPVTLCL